MVTTITESFFKVNFAPWGPERLQSCQWLQLRAANGLDILFLGYLELTVELCGKVIPNCGILVVRDPPGGGHLPVPVPGVLGMNVIRKCYHELFGQYGASLFDLPAVSAAPDPVFQALQQCHRAVLRPTPEDGSTVSVRGRKPCRVPGGSMKLVAATCSELYSGHPALFEPTEKGLPGGLLVSPALVQVSNGVVYIPVVNVGTSDSVLYPRTRLGHVDMASVVSLPNNVVEIRSIAASSTGPSSTGTTIDERIRSLDLSALQDSEQEQVRSLLLKHSSVFAAFEGDLGCNLSRDTPA